MSETVPIIDCSALFTSPPGTFSSDAAVQQVATQIHSAFTTWGIFQLTGANFIPPELTASLRDALLKFFSLPEEKKLALHLTKGGWAWRGYMPWGGEGTKGSTDQKEGFYGGAELLPTTPHPLQGMPCHGLNQLPDNDVPELRDSCLAYTENVTQLGIRLCEAMGVALKMEDGEMRKRLLDPEPVQLFRAFKYQGREGVDSFGIGEHSDFGLLTILAQNAPGLQILSPSGKWVDVPLIADSFIVNVGDILDRLTSGLYISPLHRVLPPSSTSPRLSIPFFFDPSWTAPMTPFPTTLSPSTPEIEERWARRSTFTGLRGVWGQYLAVKVKKVFPDLPVGEFEAVSRASGRHLVEVRKEPELVAVAA